MRLWKQIHTKIIIMKRVERSGISRLFSKSMPWLLRVYIDPFFNLYITLPWYHKDGRLMKQLIFETFASCSQISFPHFSDILARHFQTGKTKRSDRAHKACCNSRLGKLLIQSLEWLFHNFSKTHHFTDHTKNNWENPFFNRRTSWQQNIESIQKRILTLGAAINKCSLKIGV